MEVLMTIINRLMVVARIALIIWSFYRFMKDDKGRIDTLWYGMFVLILMFSVSVVL